MGESKDVHAVLPRWLAVRRGDDFDEPEQVLLGLRCVNGVETQEVREEEVEEALGFCKVSRESVYYYHIAHT